MSIVRKFALLTIGITSGVVVYLYSTDQDVKSKVDAVFQQIKEMKSVLTVKTADTEEPIEDSVSRNRQWVYDQWEALGF